MPRWSLVDVVRLPLVGLLAGAPTWIGCDGGRENGDAGTSDAGGDAADAEAGAVRSGAPLPPGVAPARRILAPGASLTGGGEGTCSHQIPASDNGDRWCVFTRPGGGARTELWVIDVSRAATGAGACDGSDSGCVRLTENAWMGGGLNGPFQPYANRFFGDTLVFYADAVSGPMDVHRGPAFAWRPGWGQARRISSETALECWGHPRALVAHCVEDLAGDPVRPDSFTLHAGVIADRDGLVLPAWGRVIPRNREDQLAWQAGFSPTGDDFAVSQPDPVSGIESLHAIATARIGQALPSPVAAAAQRWQISNDGKRVFFLRAGAGEPAALLVADFPGGAGARLLEERTNDYFLLGSAGQDRGVAFVADHGADMGAFRWAADPMMPAAATTLFQYQAGLDAVRMSRDLRFTAWRDPDFRVTVVQHDQLRTCALNVDPAHAAYSISFLDHAGLVFWAESDGGDRDRRDGYYTDPGNCVAKHRFARSLYFLMPIGDRGLVFADEVDDSTQRTTLKYSPIAAGKSWSGDGIVRVHEEIDGTSVLFVGPDPLLLLFTVSAGPDEQRGTYLFGPVPF
jgi:hypothetical protein